MRLTRASTRSFYPPLKEALTLSLGEGVRATYYLRVLLSLVVGALAGVLGPRRKVSETGAAWATALSVVVAAVLICACP